MSRRLAARLGHARTLGPTLALALAGCIPDTVTPLSPSDGGEPPRDLALDVDESVRPADATLDASIDAEPVTDGACPLDVGRLDGSAPCDDRGAPDAPADPPRDPD